MTVDEFFFQKSESFVPNGFAVRENGFRLLFKESSESSSRVFVGIREDFHNFIPFPRIFCQSFRDVPSGIREFQNERVVVISEIRTNHRREILLSSSYEGVRKVTADSFRIAHGLRDRFSRDVMYEIFDTDGIGFPVLVFRQKVRPFASDHRPEIHLVLVHRSFHSSFGIRNFVSYRRGHSGEKLTSSGDGLEFPVRKRLLFFY